jgi:hypothetical protein
MLPAQYETPFFTSAFDKNTYELAVYFPKMLHFVRSFNSNIRLIFTNITPGLDYKLLIFIFMPERIRLYECKG